MNTKNSHVKTSKAMKLLKEYLKISRQHSLGVFQRFAATSNLLKFLWKLQEFIHGSSQVLKFL